MPSSSTQRWLARSAGLATLALIMGAFAAPVHAQTPTTVVVRAVANDAKLIGSGVGGARITIRDATSGEILAQGVQRGGTGDTGAIMSPRDRAATVFDTEGAARFVATLELTGPTPVEVIAEGPLGTPHAVQRASASLLVLPGRHVDGEGLVLVLHGFTVEGLAPEPEGRAATGAPLRVRARVTMLCGCPTTPGGTWDADRIEIRAHLLRDGHVVAEAPLAFSGETSEYEGELQVPADAPAGDYTVRVTAVDPGRANAGMAEWTVAVGG